MSAPQDSPATMNGSAPGASQRRFRVPRSRRVVNPDARMPLMEHIRELRNRVLKALLVVTAGAIAGWYLENPVFRFITRPYCKLPVSVRQGVQPGLPAGAQGHGQNCHLIVTGLFDYFFLHLKLAIAIGIIIS